MKRKQPDARPGGVKYEKRAYKHNQMNNCDIRAAVDEGARRFWSKPHRIDLPNNPYYNDNPNMTWVDPK